MVISIRLVPKPVQFKFGEYFNQGLELFKQNIGEIIVAFLLTIVMSFIPFCGLLAIGNFYKFCRKLRNKERADVAEIFNFDDFLPYFILQLLMIAVISALYFGFVLVGIFGFSFQSIVFGNGNEIPIFPLLGIFVLFSLFFIIYFYLMTRAYYIPALISLAGIKDIGEAWRISKKMTSGNAGSIFLFVLLTSIIAYAGLLFCFIGIFLTAPLYYTFNYIAREDGLQQIATQEKIEIENTHY